MVEVDGAMGEGGGQVLRGALSLSTVTGRPVRVDRIRAGRDRPGLRPQHLAAVRAAAEVAGAEVEHAETGSTRIVFRPGEPRSGRYRFDVGTAGSAVLVLQTVLPALLEAGGTSEVVVSGGTHAAHAPPHDFLAASFLPALARAGHAFDPELERYGFYPAGGGRVRLEIRPADDPSPLELTERGPERGRRVRAVVSALPRHIAEREASVVHAMLRLRPDAMEVVEVPEEAAVGPGNAVMVFLGFEHVTGVFTGFGRKGVPAEEVAREAARDAEAWLEAGPPVGPRLADQLVAPLAAGPGGVYETVEPTAHTRTQAELVRRLTGRPVEIDRIGEERWRFEVPGAGEPRA